MAQQSKGGKKPRFIRKGGKVIPIRGDEKSKGKKKGGPAKTGPSKSFFKKDQKIAKRTQKRQQKIVNFSAGVAGVGLGLALSGSRLSKAGAILAGIAGLTAGAGLVDLAKRQKRIKSNKKIIEGTGF